MPTEMERGPIIQKIKEALEDAGKRGIHLRVSPETKFEDDWLYVCVEPTTAGERASDHAELMAQIERRLRTEGIDHVVLVPVLSD